MNKVQEIKNRVTMWDVLAKYGFEQKRRIRCPLHNGDDLNFVVKDHSFMCFSHCGGGDVIAFVQKLFGLTFTEALKKIDADFGLNLFGNRSFDEVRRAHYKQKEIEAKRDRRKEEKAKAEKKYWDALDELERLEKNQKEYAPRFEGDLLHPLYVEALKKIERQKYALDCAAEEVRRVDGASNPVDAGK